MATPIQQPWIERTWSFGFPVELHPCLTSRLRGTPARLAEALLGLAPERLTHAEGKGWSIQRHAGHLIDLEALFQGRLQEFLEGAEVLGAADMSNAATEAADHDARPIGELLSRFRRLRLGYMTRLERLSSSDFGRSALHPRLGTPMRLVDMCLFQADHDDHHLATIHALTRAGD